MNLVTKSDTHLLRSGSLCSGSRSAMEFCICARMVLREEMCSRRRFSSALEKSEVWWCGECWSEEVVLVELGEDKK